MAKKATKRTRSYSREYPIGDKPGRYLIEAPAPLWRRVKAKAKRDGVSIRSVILDGLAQWSEVERG